MYVGSTRTAATLRPRYPFEPDVVKPGMPNGMPEDDRCKKGTIELISFIRNVGAGFQRQNACTRGSIVTDHDIIFL